MLNKTMLIGSVWLSAGQSAPFIPTTISGLGLWLDAADPTSVDRDLNDRVSVWQDKSGNETHATMLVSNYQPLYVPLAVAGQGALEFENSRYLELPDIPGISGSNDRSFFAVFQHFSESDQGYLLSLGYFSTFQAGKSWRVSISGSGNLQLEITGADATTSLAPGLSPCQMACVLSGTTIADHTMWLNGLSEVLVGNSVVNTGSGEASISQQNRGGPGGFIADKAIDGLICEVLVYDSALPNADRQVIEGYLAHKWNLQESLPIGHPFKAIAP